MIDSMEKKRKQVQSKFVWNIDKLFKLFIFLNTDFRLHMVSIVEYMVIYIWVYIVLLSMNSV